MIEGFYTDPKHPNVQPKIACIIPVYIVRKDYNYFIENKLETLMMNLNAHKKFKAGVDYDIILVDHGDCPDLPYITLKKENFGYSFGAYKQAWEEFGDKYDFYLFNEDDIAPAKNNWLSEILLKFMSSKDIGAVGNWVEGRSKDENGSGQLWEVMGHTRDMMYNLDGAYTFTSAKILKEIDKIGGLTVFDVGKGTGKSPSFNECVFQSQILELGYKIVSFPNRFLVHGSEIYSGDVASQGKVAPMLNLNGRHKIPRIKKIYE